MDIQNNIMQLSQTARTTSSSSAATQSSSALDPDTFYKLLAAQLQNQDPLEQTDSSQMVLQMAQMSTIEQLNNLNETFAYFMDLNSMQIGSSMVGKEVTVTSINSEGNSETVTGIVSKVGFTSSGPILEVNGNYYEMWSVLTVKEPGQTTTVNPTDKEMVEGAESEGSVEMETPIVPETPTVDEGSLDENTTGDVEGVQ